MHPTGAASPTRTTQGEQIDHLLNPQGDRTTFSYDVDGRRTRRELADGTRASYTYDVASRLSEVYNFKSDDSVIAGFAYEYDAAGNRTSVLESGGDRVTWTYDAANRLTRERRSGASAYDTTYTYDALGNRLVKEASGARTTSTYDLANQLQTSEDSSGVTTYAYDSAGNLNVVEQPSGELTTSVWDDQNRQTNVLSPDGAITTCTYRFDRLRYSNEDSEGTTKYIWDFHNYLAETDENNAMQAVYTNEPAILRQPDQPVPQEPDHLGSELLPLRCVGLNEGPHRRIRETPPTRTSTTRAATRSR